MSVASGLVNWEKKRLGLFTLETLTCPLLGNSYHFCRSKLFKFPTPIPKKAFNVSFPATFRKLEYNSFLDFLKVLFPWLVMPVWSEIHRSKILPVTSWQLTNRTVSDISCRSQHSICQSFFPTWIYNMIQIHSNETSRPRDLPSLARSLHDCDLMHWRRLRLLLRTYERSPCSKSNSFRSRPFPSLLH